jgi:perosamine synthetase
MMKLFKPYINDKARENVQRVLLSDQIAEGEEVKLFENEFSTKTNLNNVVALNSGTSALELAYDLANILPGEEVIVPVLTCTATNIPLVRRGIKIVFADIDYDLNINIEDVKNKITPRTRAIVFVHFGGNNRGLDDLVSICREQNIVLIEDAAQAVGSDNYGKGDFTCISLQAIKTITSGDGGILVCKRDEDYAKAKRLRWFGYDRDEKHRLGDTDLVEAGYKYHMNNISAAIGRGNLEDLEKIMEHRKKIADIYKGYGLFAHTWLAGGFAWNASVLKEMLANRGIEIGQHHYRNDKYTLFKEFKSDCPIMDELEERYFFVPFHADVPENTAHLIGQTYQKYVS